jgi:hypothetical protein
VNWCQVASVKCTVFLRYHDTCYLCKYTKNYIKSGNNLFDTQCIFKLCAINNRVASGCQYESKGPNEHKSGNAFAKSYNYKSSRVSNIYIKLHFSWNHMLKSIGLRTMVATTQEPQDHDQSNIQDTASLTTSYSQTEMCWSTIIKNTRCRV